MTTISCIVKVHSGPCGEEAPGCWVCDVVTNGVLHRQCYVREAEARRILDQEHAWYNFPEPTYTIARVGPRFIAAGTDAQFGGRGAFRIVYWVGFDEPTMEPAHVIERVYRDVVGPLRLPDGCLKGRARRRTSNRPRRVAA